MRGNPLLTNMTWQDRLACRLFNLMASRRYRDMTGGAVRLGLAAGLLLDDGEITEAHAVDRAIRRGRDLDARLIIDRHRAIRRAGERQTGRRTGDA